MNLEIEIFSSKGEYPFCPFLNFYANVAKIRLLFYSFPLFILATINYKINNDKTN